MSRTTQENYFLCTFLADNVRILESAMLWKPWMNIHKSSAPLLPHFQQANGCYKYWLKFFFLFKKGEVFRTKKEIILKDDVRVPVSFLFIFFAEGAEHEAMTEKSYMFQFTCKKSK